jgi:hypothetical protein
METIPIEELWKEIIRKYDKKPRGWRALTYRSPSGFYDVLLSNPQEAWLMKQDTIYKPNPLGFGVKLEHAPEIPIAKPLSYGFRHFPIERIERTVELMTKMKASPEEIVKAVNHVLRDIVSSAPIPTYKIIKPGILEGPLYLKDLENLSKEQRELSRKLDLQLRRMFRMKYPMYG